MISPMEFHRRWIDFGRNEFIFPTLRQLIGLGFSYEDAEYVAVSGLPRWSAPNIRLHEPKTLSDDDFCGIGEDQNDNPICARRETGEIVCLNTAAPGSITYVSRSLPVFLNLILLYQEMIGKAIRTVGDGAFTESRIPYGFVLEFRRLAQEMDPKAVSDEKSFWGEECTRLLMARI